MTARKPSARMFAISYRVRRLDAPSAAWRAVTAQMPNGSGSRFAWVTLPGGRSAFAVIRRCRVSGRAEQNSGRRIRHQGLYLGYGDEQSISSVPQPISESLWFAARGFLRYVGPVTRGNLHKNTNVVCPDVPSWRALRGGYRPETPARAPIRAVGNKPRIIPLYLLATN